MEQDIKENSGIKPQTIKFFEDLLAVSPDGIVITDNTQNIIAVNKLFCSFLGQAYENVVETSLLDWLDQYMVDGLSAWLGVDKMIRTEGLCKNIEFRTIAAKETRYFSVNAAILEQTGNDETGIISIWHDVTGRRQAEIQIRKAHDELEDKVAERTAELTEANTRIKELDKLKNMFIASMSHELRTPLNSIIGFTGVVLQGMVGELNARQKDHLGRANKSAKHLHALINDVIDISKVEAGDIILFAEEFFIDEVVNEAITCIDSQAKGKGLSLEVSVTPGVRMNTDRKRVMQCILNYLSNAVKFTEKGVVNITVREVDREVEIIVKDTGIGISNEDQNRLFQPFTRLVSHLSTSVLGTGLGLYLTQKLATELLGGSVAVKSQPGQGSAFTLRLPKELV